MVREIFARMAPFVKYICTTDEKEAVGKADFIIITIRAGKEESRIIDERVALKHGSYRSGNNWNRRICNGIPGSISLSCCIIVN